MIANMIGDFLRSYLDKQIAIGIIHGDRENDALYLKKLIEEKM